METPLSFNNLGTGATISVASGTHAVNAPIVLADNVTVGGSGGLTIGGSIGDNGAGYGLTAQGPGLLVLGSVNSYSGITTLNGGTLQIGDPLALQNSTVQLSSAGVLNLNGLERDTGRPGR